MARKLVQPKVLVLVALMFLLTMTVAGQQGVEERGMACLWIPCTPVD